MERRPLIVVGSGPAGTATALYLEREDPSLAREALVLDKARHPREKVCAGGLIPHALRCLDELGVPLSVPNAVVHEALVRTPAAEVRHRRRDLCRVIRRSEFDASLAGACRERGIEVREGEHVREIVREGKELRLETDHATYLASAVVGADGSGSAVRRRLIEPRNDHTGRAVMCDVPVASTDWQGFAESRYEFDFAAVASGLHGYGWAFPCLIEGQPHVNVGVYSVSTDDSRLRSLLARQVESLGGRPSPLKAFPIHWYSPAAVIHAERVLLAGDAAGVDPLLGEGISYAFEYGRRASAALANAFRTSDFGFAAYARSVHHSWMGKKLGRLALLSRVLYGRTWPLWFRLLEHSGRAREVGVCWYNGIDDWDQKNGWSMLRALARLPRGAAASA